MTVIDEPAGGSTARDLMLTIGGDDALGVVRPQGEIDVATAPAVEQAVLSRWDEGAEAVVLDLSGVTFFDSSGLRLLIRLQTHADEHERRSFALADCSDAVQRVLDLTRLSGRFGRAPTRTTTR